MVAIQRQLDRLKGQLVKRECRECVSVHPVTKYSADQKSIHESSRRTRYASIPVPPRCVVPLPLRAYSRCVPSFVLTRPYMSADIFVVGEHAVP